MNPICKMPFYIDTQWHPLRRSFYLVFSTLSEEIVWFAAILDFPIVQRKKVICTSLIQLYEKKFVSIIFWMVWSSNLQFLSLLFFLSFNTWFETYNWNNMKYRKNFTRYGRTTVHTIHQMAAKIWNILLKDKCL